MKHAKRIALTTCGIIVALRLGVCLSFALKVQTTNESKESPQNDIKAQALATVPVSIPDVDGLTFYDAYWNDISGETVYVGYGEDLVFYIEAWGAPNALSVWSNGVHIPSAEDDYAGCGEYTIGYIAEPEIVTASYRPRAY